MSRAPQAGDSPRKLGPDEVRRDLSDEALMVRARAGSRDAFDELVTRHRGRVLAIAHRFLGPSDDAEDIAQEAFLRLYRARERYRPSARFTTFLFRIVANLCIEKGRKRKRQPSLEALDDRMPGPRSDEPEVVALERETVRRLRGALQRLPEKQRIAVILCKYEERSYREVAQALGCSEKAVETLLYRARQTLAAEFASDGQEQRKAYSDAVR